MSSLSMKWNRKMTSEPVLRNRRDLIKLINLYRKKRVLWDRATAGYDNGRMRKAAWMDISRQFSCGYETVKQKMNGLLKTYQRERKKERCPFCCRKDPREVYRSHWFAYKSLDFLSNATSSPRRSYYCDSDDILENQNGYFSNAVFLKEEPEPGFFIQEADTEFDVESNDSVSAFDEAVAPRNMNELSDDDPLDYAHMSDHFLAYNEQFSSPRVPVKRITMIKTTKSNGVSSVEGSHTRKTAVCTRIRDECDSFTDHVKTKFKKLDDPVETEVRNCDNHSSFQSQSKSSENLLVSVDPASIHVKNTWLTPVIRIPKIDIDAFD